LLRWRSTNGIFRDDDDSYPYRIGSGEAMVQGAHSWRGLKKKKKGDGQGLITLSVSQSG
jgi:hypothetical protein